MFNHSKINQVDLICKLENITGFTEDYIIDNKAQAIHKFLKKYPDVNKFEVNIQYVPLTEEEIRKQCWNAWRGVNQYMYNGILMSRKNL